VCERSGYEACRIAHRKLIREGLEVVNHHCSSRDHDKHPHTRGGGVAMKVDTFGLTGSKSLIGDFKVLLGQRASDAAAF
jgi:hypothetical protein